MNKAILKLFLLILLPALLLIAGTDYLVYSLSIQNQQRMSAISGLRTVQKIQAAFAAKLAIPLKDLSFLAFSHESSEIFSGHINQDLRDTFRAIIHMHKDYDRIRYLDTTGQEIFKINYNNDSPRIFYKKDLPSKADRYYFPKILTLGLDELYISPLDMPVEKGTIEIPPKPMLRLGSAVVNPDGTTIGILIINFLGESIFEVLRNLAKDTCCSLTLLNDRGYTLNSPNNEHEWGFMAEVGGDPSFPLLHAEIWDTINKSDHGQFMNDEGCITFATIDLRKAIVDATRLHGRHDAPEWKIVLRAPLAKDTLETAHLLNKMSILTPILVLFTILAAFFLAHLRARSRKAETMVQRQVESNARFVPSKFLDLLHKGEFTEVKLADHVQRPMTTLFTDIRSYTKLSEGMTPQKVLAFLNAYYQVLNPIITKHRGFIDAFIGDAVMALFPQGPEGAIRAAIEIQIALRDFSFSEGKGEQRGVRSGFGLHYGEVTLGAVGTDTRMQTTAIGDAVNLAARIESATKRYKTSIIASAHAIAALPNPEQFHLRSIDLVRVKGKQEVVELFEIFDADPKELLESKQHLLELFNQAMAHYRSGEFEQAVEAFTILSEHCPQDPIPPIFIKRSNTMTRIPPGDGWTGVSTL